MKQFFKDVGDDSKKINISIPANIRFKFYPTPNDVKLENKFAAIPLTVPLATTMDEAYPLVKKASRHIKNGFASFCMVYGTYVIQKTSSMLQSRLANRLFLDYLSS